MIRKVIGYFLQVHLGKPPRYRSFEVSLFDSQPLQFHSYFLSADKTALEVLKTLSTKMKTMAVLRWISSPARIEPN